MHGGGGMIKLIDAAVKLYSHLDVVHGEHYQYHLSFRKPTTHTDAYISRKIPSAGVNPQTFTTATQSRVSPHKQ